LKKKSEDKRPKKIKGDYIHKVQLLRSKEHRIEPWQIIGEVKQVLIM
jgi:hypothetical protein